MSAADMSGETAMAWSLSTRLKLAEADGGEVSVSVSGFACSAKHAHTLSMRRDRLRQG